MLMATTMMMMTEVMLLVGTDPKPRDFIDRIKKKIVSNYHQPQSPDSVQEAKKHRPLVQEKQEKRKKVGCWWERVPQVMSDDGGLDPEKFVSSSLLSIG
eukprot:748895-Hanusia_phi.AAC.3